MAEARPGDWECPDCGALCFASRETCFKCDKASGGGGGRRPGDWDCPDCGALCFASRETCFKCERGGGEGTKGGRKPGDWDCPDCGALCFASRETCFKCDRAASGGSGGKGKGKGKGGGKGRKPGDWDCPDCGALVFANRSSCFQCGGEGAGADAVVTRDAVAAKGATTAGAAIKAFAKASPLFKSSWTAYCKKYGDGFSDPGKYEENFIAEWADHVGALVLTGLGQAVPDAANHITAAAQAAEEVAAAKKRELEQPAVEPAAKKKVTMKKNVADRIKSLNESGCLLQPIRLVAVAAALAQLSEEAALDVLNMVEEQQADIEDTTDFVNSQAQSMA